MSSVRNRLFHTDSFRQATLYAGLFAVSMIILIAIVFVILDHSFKANLLREIGDDLTSIQTAYATAKHGKAEHEAKEMIDDRLLAPDVDDVFLLQKKKRRLAGNIPVMTPRLGTFSMPMDPEGKRIILGKGAMLSADDYAFVGRDLHQLNETEAGILKAFGVVLLASLMLATGSGILLSRSFLKRVDAVTETCHGIMAGRLGQRIDLAGQESEFDRLGLAINAMLDRIQALMESLKQVSSDIAHDMRTPLTHLRHKLERARNEATTPGDYAAAVDGAVAECDKLLAIFTALLRIAQIEAGSRRSEFCDVDLALVVEKARDIYAPVMEDAGRVFHAATETLPKIRGDEQLLLQLVSNLLNNALTHTSDGTEVRLACTAMNGSPALIVADRGPGIPHHDRNNVLKRFYRREQSRTRPGSGLGLSLVAAISELHEAALELDDNNPGLRVIVQFRTNLLP